MADFTIKQNDRLPEIQGQCVDADGNPVDLTGATAVAFHMKTAEAGSPKVNSAGVIVDAPTGIVKYAWAAVDTDTAGDYLAEFEVNFGGKTQTFPNVRNLEITVVDDLV